MTIPWISPNIEKPFRNVLGHAVRNEIDELHGVLLGLTDRQIINCANLSAFVAGYIAITACGRQWPIDKNLRRIGEGATISSSALAFGLKADDVYAYVKRVALGGETADAVFPTAEDPITLSFFITGQLLVAFGKVEEHWWDYLTRIEEAYEAAQATDLDLLPALMLRARRPVPPTGPPSPSGADAATS